MANALVESRVTACVDPAGTRKAGALVGSRVAACATPADVGKAQAKSIALDRLLALREELEDTQFPDELLECWTRREAVGLSAVEGGSPLPSEARSSAVRMIGQILNLMRLPIEFLGRAVVMLDVYVARASSRGSNVLDTLPATVVIICRILFGLHNGPQTRDIEGTLRYFEAGFAKWMEAAGYLKAAKPCESLGKWEQEVLRTLEWRVDMPSPMGWFDAYRVRLDVASRGLLSPSLKWIGEQGALLSSMAALACTYEDMQPKQFAIGMLCHGLVAARLLPVAVFHDQEALKEDCPPCLFSPDASSGSQEVQLSPREQETLWMCLLLAVGENPEDLRSAFVRFADCMRACWGRCKAGPAAPASSEADAQVHRV